MRALPDRSERDPPARHNGLTAVTATGGGRVVVEGCLKRPARAPPIDFETNIMTMHLSAGLFPPRLPTPICRLPTARLGYGDKWASE
jgi:hypothetical protein